MGYCLSRITLNDPHSPLIPRIIVTCTCLLREQVGGGEGRAAVGSSSLPIVPASTGNVECWNAGGKREAPHKIPLPSKKPREGTGIPCTSTVAFGRTMLIRLKRGRRPSLFVFPRCKILERMSYQHGWVALVRGVHRFICSSSLVARRTFHSSNLSRTRLTGRSSCRQDDGRQALSVTVSFSTGASSFEQDYKCCCLFC